MGTIYVETDRAIQDLHEGMKLRLVIKLLHTGFHMIRMNTWNSTKRKDGCVMMQREIAAATRFRGSFHPRHKEGKGFIQINRT